MVSIEIVNQAASMILMFCSANHPGFTTESIRECVVELNNCAVEGGGITANDDKLQKCVAEARKELKRETYKK